MSSSEEKESPNATKNDNLRSWNTEEVEKLIIHFFNHREVLVKEVREKNEKIFLNKLAGDLTSADFKPSAKQIRGKFRTIFLNAKPGTEKNKTKAEEEISQDVKNMIDWIWKEVDESTGTPSAKEDDNGSPTLESKEGVTPTTPGPSVAKSISKTPDLDEQNKKERQEKMKELTGIVEKLKLDISKMERGLHELTECYNTTV